MSLHIDSIRIDGGTQSRASINEATVAEYAEAMADPATVFPPVIAYFDGREYWLADGFHRLAAWRQIGCTDIPAEIRQGDRRAAILHSVAANSAHGLRRTNDDKRRAVLTLLEDAEWSAWSDREVARRCGVSQPFVSGIRAGLSDNGYQMPDTRTVERNGTTYQQNTANIGGKAEDQISDGLAAAHMEEAWQAEMHRREIQSSPGPVEQAEDPEIAKARKALAALTRTGLEDEVIGLRADLAEAKRKNAEQRAEIARLKGLNAAFNGDKDEVIRRLNKTIEHKNSEMYRANEKADAAMRQVHVLKKRVAELEQMGIAL